ncbi:MAG: hypothetical protein IIC07_02390, partial [Proteobacteria bacterium]|nr:hypothetical protein [Pseudomonadota bacterium]
MHIKLEPGDAGYQVTEKEQLRAEILAEEAEKGKEPFKEPRELSEDEEKELFRDEMGLNIEFQNLVSHLKGVEADG